MGCWKLEYDNSKKLVVCKVMLPDIFCAVPYLNLSKILMPLNTEIMGFRQRSVGNYWAA